MGFVFGFKNTPLHWASANGHLSVVQYLVNQNADINAKNYRIEFYFLMILHFILHILRVINVLWVFLKKSKRCKNKSGFVLKTH